jgi:hypothetical protein
VELNPGIPVLLEHPFRFIPSDQTGSRLGFLKLSDQWGLCVWRGKFAKSGDSWRPIIGAQVGVMVRLLEATREERVAALDEFPRLLEALTKEAKDKLALVEAANKRAV